MAARIIGSLLAVLIAVVALYLSRFWVFDLWSRDGLLGIEALRPQGDLLRRWLRGTMFAPYDLLIWMAAGFGLLTVFQMIWDRLTR